MKFEIFGRKFEFFSSLRQWEKLKALCAEYILHPAVICAVGLLFLYFILYFYMRAKHKSALLEKIRLFAPVLYLFCIIALSLLNRTPGTRGDFHFFFDFIFAGTTYFHETRVLMAILDFLYYIPYGFLLRWSNPHIRAYGAVGLASLTAFAIEILQWLFALGVGTAEHWLICTFGAVIGVVCFVPYKKIHKSRRSGAGDSNRVS